MITRSSILIFIIIVEGSCATIVNQRTVDVRIMAEQGPVEICMSSDTTRWYETPAWIYPERSKEDLLLFARNGSIQKPVRIHSKLSPIFLYGNFFYGGGPVGYAIDLTNNKRFTYPKHISINLSDDAWSGKPYVPWLKPERGLLTFKLSYPVGNFFYINQGDAYGNSFGFLGLSAGAEYYIRDNWCLNSDLGGLMDFFIPFPAAAVDYEGDHSTSSAVYADLQAGTELDRFHFDGGLQLTHSSFYEVKTISVFPQYIDTLLHHERQLNFGPSFSGYCRISNNFNLGLNYYPSFFYLNSGSFGAHYSHLLFFELIFRLEAFRPVRDARRARMR